MKGQDNPLIPNPHPHLLNSIIRKPIIVPSSYQHKKTHKPRKSIRTNKISQSSGPFNLVADETVYKEWEDRMEMAATTASSLDAEQDSGELVRINIDDGNAFCNEIEVNAANSNLMLLALVNAARHNLVLPVQVNAAEAKVKTINGECQIQALVDKKKMIITETSIRSDLHLEDADGTDCFPTTTIFEELARMGRSRIEAIDKDAEVTLVETQRRNDENDDNMMFDTSVFNGDEIVVETEEPVINAATTTKSIPVSTDEIDLAQEITLAQALAAIKSAKPKKKDVVQESS
ncbi:hypothetical protein Tco_1504988 [Tanacetum coccineum]